MNFQLVSMNQIFQEFESITFFMSVNGKCGNIALDISNFKDKESAKLSVTSSIHTLIDYCYPDDNSLETLK